jgi:ATP-dependent RNA helicase TDRD9
MVTEGKVLSAHIYSVVGGVASIILFNRNGISINNCLVTLGFAAKREESFLSRKDNIVRQRPQFQPLSRAQEFKDLPDPIKIFTGPPPPKKECLKPYEFKKSPQNPLETRLVSLAKFTDDTNILIDANSVNQILLDTEPEQEAKRYYIGANVTERTDRNPNTFSVISKTVTIRETTCLPNIPGIAMILALVFCPFAEIRKDRLENRFTTVLTGMGFDEETKHSLFGERDVVFDVDVELREVDLLKVRN